MSAALHARLALAAAMLCLILMGARVWGSVSLAEPLQLITSGDEQSSLLAIWKFAQGLPVYHDRFKEPYDAILFNWLFYASYGTVWTAAKSLLGLSDIWLPSLVRLFSLLAALTASVAAFLAYRRESGAALGLALALVAGLGPLMGFWAVTARPDPWAFAFEAASAAAFLALWPRTPWRALAVFGLLAYLGWSFKQNCVFTMGAVGLFLLIRRRWAMAGALAVGMPLAWAATLVLGGEGYRAGILFAGYPFDFSLAHAVGILANAAVKTMPLWLLAAAALILSRPARRAVLDSDAALLGGLGVLVAGGLAFAAGAQTGAAENYFFSAAFHLGLLAAGLAGKADRRVLAVSGLGWAALGAAALAVLSGKAGLVDNRPQHQAMMAAKSCLDPLPRPLFVNHPYLSLPWMSPGATPYVLSYTYAKERAMGRAFEHGGIGGLIEAGRFAALALGEEAESHDGGSLAGYAVQGKCAGMTLYLRRQAS